MPEKLNSLASHHSSVAQILANDEGGVVWHNPAFLSNFGPYEALSQEFLKLIRSTTYLETGCLSEILESGLAVNLKRVISPIEKGDILHLIEVLPPNSISKLALNESLNKGIIDIDPLTGVLGRAGIEREIDRWISMIAERPFALLFLDLDGFKQINDRHGHLEGDECLRRVSNSIVDTLRTGDVIGRFGGDEFVLLIAGVSCDHEVESIVERIKKSVTRTKLPDLEFPLSVSIGWAFSNSDMSPTDLLKEADKAMYAKKGATSDKSTA